MKKILFISILSAIVLSFTSCRSSDSEPDSSSLADKNNNLSGVGKLNNTEYSFSVFQFNIWQEGTKVSGGYEAVVNEIAAREPDFVTLSEIRNYNNTSFDQRIVASLKAKGKTYYALKGNDNGVLSKYPIKEYSEFSAYHRLLTEIVPGNEIAVYSGHLDYTNYAVNYPRGYDPVTFNELPAPVTDPVKISQSNNSSNRPKEIQEFLARVKEDIAKGRTIVLGGDFNEASHLDWTEAVKNLYDHRGVVMNWNSTLTLSKNGFKDSYRVMYPNEVEYPGFTWPAQASWAPKADERDRIDYIFYYDDGTIRVKDSYIVGPKKTVVKNTPQLETSKDKFSEPVGIWPTDHKGVWTTFAVKTKNISTPAISLNKTAYALNENINIVYSNGSADPKAWIGIYRDGIIPGQNTAVNYSTKWEYTNGQINGSLNFKLNNSGKYFAAYFKDGGYTEIAPRVYFTYGN
ncbi:Endonuclease/Exonuclease/phosphatase family protein [Chryseobacterium rhizoplanae]|uniref:Endonuclease/Exonuclease/phosphatase family protein n=1 Tax=Chryseobacterium rhizoplanae TaxID=1609531 RepID=A0A521BHX4_9FLAO|nr:endonuclease/exonuclease/phosphatase family protein [Chryseobacterium rhizoplanae]SMO46666.1 Endonuclease/Exonuclease/phosphatase family protein [Chryseobacterium rhizoplanae]